MSSEGPTGFARLKAARVEKGWSVREVGDMVERTYNAVHMLENGEIKSPELVGKLAVIFGLDADLILLEEGRIPAWATPLIKKYPQDILSLLRALS